VKPIIGVETYGVLTWGGEIAACGAQRDFIQRASINIQNRAMHSQRFLILR
jgi:hypothetical protein